MVVQVLLALVGLVVLTVAADHLVLGSARIAQRLRISPVVVGVVVIGLGTSAPEFLVSGVAATRGDVGIAIGNIVGSNILNLTLILGVAALIRPVRVASSVIRHEVPLSVAAVGALAVAGWRGLDITAGIALGVANVVALGLLVRWARAGRNAELVGEVEDFEQAEPALDLGLPTAAAATPRPALAEGARAVLGLVGVLAGAQLLVVNASAIAEHLGVPQIVIGFTLVALGTSLPELVTAIQAQRRGETDLVVGNLFGSNLFNSLAGGCVVGVASATSATAVDVGLVIVMLVTTVVAALLLRRGHRLSRIEAVVLLAAYALTLPVLVSP